MPSLKIDLIVDDKGNVVIQKAKANLNELEQATGKLNASFTQFSGIFNKLAIATFGVLSVKGMYDLVAGSLEAQHQLALTAEKVGIAATSLKVYEYAAKVSGLEVESMTRGIGILSKNMMGAAVDVGGAAQSFKALGLSTKDAQGNLKPTEQMIGEIADKFKAMEAGAGKTALAMALFGRSGKDMIPFLNEGRTGIAAVRKEMESLGFTFDRDAIERAGEVQDKFERLGMVSQNIGTQITTGLVPALDQLVEMLIEAAKHGESFRGVGESLGTGLKGLAAIAIGVAASFDLLGTSIGETMARGVMAFQNSSILQHITGISIGKGLYATFFGGLGKDDFSSLQKKIDQYGNMINKLWEPPPLRLTNPPGAKGDAPLVDSEKAKKTREEFELWLGSLEKLNPLLSQIDRDMVEINKQGEKFKERGISEEQIRAAEALAQEYLEQKQAIENAKTANELYNKVLDVQLTMARDLERIGVESVINKAKGDIDYAKRMLDVFVQSGEIAPTEAIEKRFVLERQLLDIEQRRIDLFAIQTANEEDAYRNWPKQLEAILALEERRNNLTREQAYETKKSKIDAEKEAYDTLKFFAADYHLFQSEQLDRLANKFKAAGLDQVTIERWKNEELKKQQIEYIEWRLKYAETFGEAMKLQLTLEELQHTSNWAKMAESATYSFQIIGDSFGSIFHDSVTGDLKSFDDYWSSFVDRMASKWAQTLADMVADWLRSLAEMAVAEGGGGFLSGITGGIGGFFGSIFGGGAAAGGIGALMADTPALAPLIMLAHKGGIVGDTSFPTRPAAVEAFFNAPRLHRGLAPDERPAILQTGEEVIPRAGTRRGGDIHIHLHEGAIKGSVVTTKQLARELVGLIAQAKKEGAH